MLCRLEKYADDLETQVKERTAELEEEKLKTDLLLHRMLPRSGIYRKLAHMQRQLDSKYNWSQNRAYNNYSLSFLLIEVINVLFIADMKPFHCCQTQVCTCSENGLFSCCSISECLAQRISSLRK
jgi:hypothetical protein